MSFNFNKQIKAKSMRTDRKDTMTKAIKDTMKMIKVRNELMIPKNDSDPNE